MHETFWTLLRDSAHWEFEIFLTLLTEAATAGIGWLVVRKHWRHHIARDKAETMDVYGSRRQNQGRMMETPKDICGDCGGTKVALDGVDLCVGCGDIRGSGNRE